MKINNRVKTVIVLILLIFSFEIVLFSPNAFPQNLERIEDNIGGSGTNTVQPDSKNDNTFLYVAAAAIVVGLIVWKVFLNKKEPKAKDEIKTDSTKTSVNKSFYMDLSKQELQLEKIENQIPFEIILGSWGSSHNIPGENVFVGLKIKL